MALRAFNRRTGWLLLAVVVGHIILISAQVTTRRGVPLLEEVTFGMFAEVQRAATAAARAVWGAWHDYFALQRIRQENKWLRQEVARLRLDLQQERAVAQQSRTLQRLLELRDRIPLSTTGSHVTATTVIGSGASPQFRTITIDKGTSDGIRADMAVIGAEGVVGRVIMPVAGASKVQLLIDRDAAAGAIVERSRAQGIVVGNGTDRLLMQHVSATADIQVGDTVVTSGIEGFYPKGFVIGQIESIQGDARGRVIVVRPAVDFSALEAVLVVLTPPSRDEADGFPTEAGRRASVLGEAR
jgi:rod shape-determining protein MreC